MSREALAHSGTKLHKPRGEPNANKREQTTTARNPIRPALLKRSHTAVKYHTDKYCSILE
ncbi:hypothetical protein RvY_08652 [Ramazzottius varieornatus]|uniref:Uncharacterized protein n=1 Tax=Ramazzottius varieornatus TaxID=947166 RepID=A0A1D1VEL4_RAMVA|nr:hypothetical protein RvY_08652 [Ramazzottius varieornatus]